MFRKGIMLLDTHTEVDIVHGQQYNKSVLKGSMFVGKYLEVTSRAVGADVVDRNKMIVRDGCSSAYMDKYLIRGDCLLLTVDSGSLRITKAPDYLYNARMPIVVGRRVVAMTLKRGSTATVSQLIAWFRRDDVALAVAEMLHGLNVSETLNAVRLLPIPMDEELVKLTEATAPQILLQNKAESVRNKILQSNMSAEAMETASRLLDEVLALDVIV